MTSANNPALPTPRAALARLPSAARDLQGLSRLGVEAALGITGLVEAMHHTIASGTRPVGPSPSGLTSGITGTVYRGVRGAMRTAGWGMDALFGALAKLPLPAQSGLPDPQALAPVAEREAVLAVLNGLWGDRLAASANPLAIPMALRVAGLALPMDGKPWSTALPQANGRVLLMVHGLCMNDLQFKRQGHDHGQALAQSLGYTPVYLHYNSGEHIATNGRQLAALLGELLSRWPVPVTELVIVGHSMGGLVARSACHVAEQLQQPWLGKLSGLVFLGTPHQGAPLERGGHLVDRLLGISPYIAPFARIGKARSAGIVDLRFGHVQAPGADQAPRADLRHDDRLPTPLPIGVPAYLVAATTGPEAQGRRAETLGDGLVPLSSALGRHTNPALALDVPAERQLVVTRANHWDLLNRPEVSEALLRWLGTPAAQATPPLTGTAPPA